MSFNQFLFHLSNEKKPGWLGYIGDYTLQLYRDYNKPLQGSLLTNQYNRNWEGFFRGSPGSKMHNVRHATPMVSSWFIMAPYY